MTEKKILIAGYRPQIATRLHKLEIPFVCWHDRPVKKRNLPGCIRLIDDEPFPASVPAIKRKLNTLFDPTTQFSHVIGGTESSVVTASVARRTFGRRKSRNTVVLRCHNKRMMKEFLQEKGFPLIPFIYAASKDESPLSTSQVIDRLGLPVVVKQLGTSGGRGLVIARCADELEPFLQQKVLFEKFVDAPEVSVESFICQRNLQFTSITQYVKKTLVNLVPSGHSTAINHALLKLNRRVAMALNIQWGLTHAEYYLADDQIYFGEIAIRPPGGYIMDLISLAYDFDAWEAFVDNELELATSFPTAPIRWAAAVLFHPGAGRIKSIAGVDEIRSDANCKKIHLHCRAGESIGPREGVSETAGFALFCSDTRDETMKSISRLERQLIFEMEK